MSDYVWILKKSYLADSNLLPDYHFDFIPFDQVDPETGVHPQETMIRLVFSGALLTDEFIPQKAITRYRDSKINLERDVIMIGAHIAVSARIHDLIKDFDYGPGGDFIRLHLIEMASLISLWGNRIFSWILRAIKKLPCRKFRSIHFLNRRMICGAM